MNKKSQVAMEMAMTYGSALLIVMIATGALIHYDILDVSTFLPEKFDMETFEGGEFIIIKDTISLQGIIHMEIYNPLDKDINLDTISITGEGDMADIWSGCIENVNEIIAKGTTATIMINCDIQADPDDRITGTVNIEYTLEGSTLDRSAQGEISGVVRDYEDFQSHLEQLNLECTSTDERCDGEDNNCNGLVDEGLERTCGYGPCIAQSGCLEICSPDLSQMTDESPESQTCADGIDNDCDNFIDNLDRDCFACECEDKLCDYPNNKLCNGCIYVDPYDEFCDGIDNNCNGEIDENCQLDPSITFTSSTALPSPDYPNSLGELSDGQLATNNPDDPGWVGYTDSTFDLIVDLGTATTIDSVSANFLSNTDNGIYLPQSVTIYTSEDGITFTEVSTFIIPSDTADPTTFLLEAGFPPVTAQYVKYSVTADSQSDVTLLDEINVLSQDIPIEISEISSPQLPSSDYPNSLDELSDGTLATNDPTDPGWVGYTDDNFDITLDLGGISTIDSASMHLLSNTDTGIYLPQSVTIYTSEDGITFTEVSTFTIPSNTADPTTFLLEASFSPTTAQYVKYSITADPLGDLTLIDEIMASSVGCECDDTSCKDTLNYPGFICGTCDYTAAPDEICNDGIDNNCNGETDENCLIDLTQTTTTSTAIPSINYPDSGNELNDGLLATNDPTDPGWVGYTNDNFEITLDLGSLSTIDSALLHVLSNTDNEIYLPQLITIFAGETEGIFVEVGSLTLPPPDDTADPTTFLLEATFQPIVAQYIKFVMTANPLGDLTLIDEVMASSVGCVCDNELCRDTVNYPLYICNTCDYIPAPDETCNDATDNNCDGTIDENCQIDTSQITTISTATPDPQYPDTTGQELTDGLVDSNDPNDEAWVGYTDSTFDITLDLGTISTINSVSMHTITNTDNGIYLPQSVTIYTSEDGITFTEVSTFIIPPNSATPENVWLETNFPEISARYIKYSITADPLGQLTLIDDIAASTAGCDCYDTLCEPGYTGRVCSNCNYLPAPTEICDDGIDNDCDIYSDYDSQNFVHGDSNCPISISAISVTNTIPLKNTKIDVLCTTSVPNINSIRAFIGTAECNGDTPLSAWLGNTFTFKDCPVGGLIGSKEVKCTIDPDKSYQTGPDQTTQIQVLSCYDSDSDTYYPNIPDCVLAYNPIEFDCDNSNKDVNPGMDELCTDTVDNNCDDVVNEGCEIQGQLTSTESTGTTDPSYPNSGDEHSDGAIAPEDPTDPGWVGYTDSSFDITLDLGFPSTINKASMHLLSNTDNNIYLPLSATVSISIDGSSFTQVGTFTIPLNSPTPQSEWVDTIFTQELARYIKFSITADPTKITLIDEVTVSTVGCDCDNTLCEPGYTGRICTTCDYEPAPSEICADFIDNDCDGKSDYDTQDGRPSDTNCPVGVSAISVTDLKPIEFGVTDVYCTTNVPDINSIRAFIGETECDGDSIGSIWSGTTYLFKDCPVGAGGSKTVRCVIDETKSYIIPGQEERTQDVFVKRPDGDPCAENWQCMNDFCRTDFDGAGLFCAASSTNCVFDHDSDGFADQILNGYMHCGSNAWYRTCQNGLWSANNYCPDTADTLTGYNHCTTETKDKTDTDYSLPTCTSGPSTVCGGDQPTVTYVEGYDCNQLDCTTGSECSGIDTATITEIGDDYICSGGTCPTSIKKTCGNVWTCQYSTRCQQQNCYGTIAKCYYDTSWKYKTSAPAEVCADNYDNNCDGKAGYDGFNSGNIIPTLTGDSACPIEVTAISVSSTTPYENTNIDVSCTTSVADINSIEAYIDTIPCTWIAWSGNTATFSCNVGTVGTKTAKCTLNTLKSYQTGTDETQQIVVDICQDLDIDTYYPNTPYCVYQFNPAEFDCDDNEPNANPGLAEDCGGDGKGDGIDNNCDGTPDEGCCTCYTTSGCCDGCQPRTSGSQPSGYNDYYYCSGGNSATGTNYVKKRDYACNGIDTSIPYSDSTVDTCGICEICNSGQSTCGFYSSATQGPTADTYALDTANTASGTNNCIQTDYHCTGTSAIETSNPVTQTTAPPCKKINGCTGTTLGSLANYADNTVCGTDNYCSGGSCLAYTYIWKTGTWGACTGSQTRNVWCERQQDSTTVADSKCDPATKPTTTNTCIQLGFGSTHSHEDCTAAGGTVTQVRDYAVNPRDQMLCKFNDWYPPGWTWYKKWSSWQGKFCDAPDKTFSGACGTFNVPGIDCATPNLPFNTYVNNEYTCQMSIGTTNSYGGYPSPSLPGWHLCDIGEYDCYNDPTPSNLCSISTYCSNCIYGTNIFNWGHLGCRSSYQSYQDKGCAYYGVVWNYAGQTCEGETLTIGTI